MIVICNPLRYTTIMNNKLCCILALGSWLGGFAVNTIITAFMSKLKFYGPNTTDHFFCDFAPLIELSFSDTHLNTIVDFSFSIICACPPFLLTLATYVCIISTILRIPSTSGRQKTFSTCSSHLTVDDITFSNRSQFVLIACWQQNWMALVKHCLV